MIICAGLADRNCSKKSAWRLLLPNKSVLLAVRSIFKLRLIGELRQIRVTTCGFDKSLDGHLPNVLFASVKKPVPVGKWMHYFFV